MSKAINFLSSPCLYGALSSRASAQVGVGSLPALITLPAGVDPVKVEKALYAVLVAHGLAPAPLKASR